MKSYGTILLVASISFSYLACDEGGADPIKDDYTHILVNLGNNVILKTYQDLDVKTAALKTATETLLASPTDPNLTAARNAWVAARSPWEQSEGFLFGPVDQEGLDPSLDSWPVNVTDLNNVLASSNTLTTAFLQQQEGTLKGFHTIEFLLWGESGVKQIGQFTAREYEYLAAASGALAADAAALYSLWNPADGNYVNNVLQAGNGSNIYISQKAALEEITNAMIVIADEVGNGKINDPFAQEDLTLEESRFSANSKADFANNVRSIQNIYLGKFGTSGDNNGISDIIQEKNAALDQQVQTEITLAITAIENIPGTFSDAVFDAKTEVAAAQQAVRNLQETLESEVLPVISNL